MSVATNSDLVPIFPHSVHYFPNYNQSGWADDEVPALNRCVQIMLLANDAPLSSTAKSCDDITDLIIVRNMTPGSSFGTASNAEVLALCPNIRRVFKFDVVAPRYSNVMRFILTTYDQPEYVVKLVVDGTCVDPDSVLIDMLPRFSALDSFQVRHVLLETQSFINIIPTVTELLLQPCNAFNLTDAICECTRLKVLVLIGVDINNPFPPAFPAMAALRTVRLSGYGTNPHDADTHSRTVSHNLDAICSLTSLHVLSLHHFPGVVSIPAAIKSLVHLTSLDLANINIRTLPPAIEVCQALTHITLSSCPMLTSLPDEIGLLPDLVSLVVTGCDSFVYLPGCLPGSDTLRLLDVSNCKALRSLPIGIAHAACPVAIIVTGSSQLVFPPYDSINQITDDMKRFEAINQYMLDDLKAKFQDDIRETIVVEAMRLRDVLARLQPGVAPPDEDLSRLLHALNVKQDFKAAPQLTPKMASV